MFNRKAATCHIYISDCDLWFYASIMLEITQEDIEQLFDNLLEKVYLKIDSSSDELEDSVWEVLNTFFFEYDSEDV